MEAEIVEFSKRDSDIRLIRRWWRSNPAFSTIDEDIVFEDLLENHFTKIVAFMAFMWMNNENPKDVVVFSINSGTIDELRKPEMNFEEIENMDGLIEKFLMTIKNELEKEEILNDEKIRERLESAFNALFGM